RTSSYHHPPQELFRVCQLTNQSRRPALRRMSATGDDGKKPAMGEGSRRAAAPISPSRSTNRIMKKFIARNLACSRHQGNSRHGSTEHEYEKTQGLGS
ncbi:hypothetical protein E2562_034671, partial [Oryza meyeriana var. granulata]